MAATCGRLIARFLGTLLAASLLIFGLLRAVPGNPALVALGVTATPEAVTALSQQLGTDRPLSIQYLTWLGGLFTGDFGISLASRTDMTPIVLDRAAVSLILCGCAVVLALLIALPLGSWAALRAGRWDAAVVSVASQLGIAVPSFLAAILLVAVVSVRAGLLPAAGWVPPAQGFGRFLSHLALPVLALALVQSAILTRYVRSAVLEVAGRDFMRTARAAGLSRPRALWRHGLRNAALPLLTVLGLQLTSLIVGAVVVEKVFALPGLGSLLLDSVAARDLTTVQSVVMLLVVFTLTVNLVVDLLTAVVDPRTKR